MNIRPLTEEELSALIESPEAQSSAPVSPADQIKKQLQAYSQQQQSNEATQEKIPSDIKGLKSYFAEKKSQLPQEYSKQQKDMGALAIRAAQSIPNLLALPENIRNYVYDNAEPDTAVGKFVQSFGKPAQKLSNELEKLGNEESLNSEDFINKTLQLSAGNLPLLVLTGGAGISKLAGDVLASAGMVGAEKMGFGTAGQILGGALAGAGFNKLANIAKGTPAARPKLIEDLYKKENQYGSKIKLDKDKIVKPFNEIYSDTLGKQRNLYSKKLATHIDNSLNDLNYTSNLTASDVVKQKGDFNNIYRAMTDPSQLDKSLMNRMNKTYNKTLKNIGTSGSSKNAQWWKYADSVNNIYKIDKWQDGLINTLKSTKELSKKAKEYLYPLGFLGSAATAALGLPAAAKFGAGAATLGAAGVAGKYGINNARSIYHMMRTPEGRKIYADLVAAGAKESPSLANKALTNLNRYMKKNEEKSNKPAIRMLSEEELQAFL